MGGIGVILNPHSRSNRHNPERLRRLSFIVGDRGSCHTTQDILDVHKIAADFAAREIDVLCISGGDGTIHHTISTFLRVYGEQPLPKITLLRGGTVNNVATAVKMRGTPEAILSRLILRYHDNVPLEVTPLHCLDVNGNYGFLFGNGFVHRFINEYIHMGEGGGKNLALLVFRLIYSSALQTAYTRHLAVRFDAKVVIDGKEWPFKNFTVIDAGTVELFGLGFNPFFRARERPHHFHAIGYAMTPRQMFTEFVRVWAGDRRGSEDRIDTVAQEMVVETKEPLGYMIDGELYPPTARVVVRCGPVLQMVTV